jgi:hypothetical protein
MDFGDCIKRRLKAFPCRDHIGGGEKARLQGKDRGADGPPRAIGSTESIESVEDQ